MNKNTSKANVDLFNKPGTIAYALKENVAEFYNINNLVELKAKLVEIVDRSDIKDTKAVETFKEIMNSKKSRRVLLDIITTYMTGIKKI